MTTYGAYDAGLPCKNTACKSHGESHPNCRCYGDGLASGGEVSHFCSENRMHDRDCEYYADGGEVGGSLKYLDSNHAIAGHILHSGLLGMLKMDQNPDLTKYDKSVNKGHKNLHEAVENVFRGQNTAVDDRSRHRQLIEDWMDKGGITKNIQQEMINQSSFQKFAEGGSVDKLLGGVLNNHPIERAYPEQNILLQAAKGRASNYLAGLRPQENMPKLAFDDNPDQTHKKKTFENALEIADHPLSVLNKVAKGTITPEHVQHLSAMFPETHLAMQKKITEKIIDSQLNEEKPHATIRQGLSLLMGTPLSGEFSPQNMIAAQGVFASKQSSAQPPAGKPPSKNKKSTSTLTNSDKAYLTGPQAQVVRSQRQT